MRIIRGDKNNVKAVTEMSHSFCMMIQDKGQYRRAGADFNQHSNLNANVYADTNADSDAAAAFVISGV